MKGYAKNTHLNSKNKGLKSQTKHKKQEKVNVSLGYLNGVV